jgi:hypothetical protein
VLKLQCRAWLCPYRLFSARLLRAAADADDRAMQHQSFRVLIGEIRQDDKTNVILGKARDVLPETELLKPLRNLLHRGPHPRYAIPDDLSIPQFLRCSLHGAQLPDRLAPDPRLMVQCA